MSDKDKFRFRGDQDMDALHAWLKNIGVNTCSLSEGRFVQVGHQRYTVGGNPKSYKRYGGIITNTNEDAGKLFETLATHFSKGMPS